MFNPLESKGVKHFQLLHNALHVKHLTHIPRCPTCTRKGLVSAPTGGCHAVTGGGKMDFNQIREPEWLPNLVEISGLEPELAEPKSVVLPLHHTSVPSRKCSYFLEIPA